MAVVRQGINTGLLGYSLKKEFLGDALCFRETQVFTYEIYSTDFVSGSPAIIHSGIYNEFRNRYSGDIYVKVFDVPAEYNFPNDHIHVAKYRVSVEVKSSPSQLFSGQGLTGAYYSGIDSSFWTTYGPNLIDFKEDFSFDTQEAGTKSFSHDISFSLTTGTRQMAVQIASGIFASDKDTTFGITAMVGGVEVANTNNFQDFFVEVYDQIRQNYRFTKRRDIAPFSGSLAVYSINHSLDFREDGVFDVTENGNIQGKLSFGQAQTTVDTLLSNAYNRCNAFYSLYDGLVGSNGSVTLSTTPTKTSKGYNRKSLSAEYSISYTTNPSFKSDGTSIDEVFDLQANELNYVDLKHRLNFTANRRIAASTTFIDLLTDSANYSPNRASNFYGQQGALYSAALPLQQIKYEWSWPNRDSRASASYDYSNNPKYFKTVNGVPFKFVDFRVQNVKPVDIINEYKVINRPTKFSVLNYAYQTEKGQLMVTVNGGLGRNPSEFVSGFRNNYGDALIALYKYGISIFMNQFSNVIPTAFTYFLADLKYSLDQDGMLSVMLTFNYTVKKYTL